MVGEQRLSGVGLLSLAPASMLYDAYFSYVCIHSLHPEQHMERLSKAAVSMFGHNFSDRLLFGIIDAAERERLLARVPAPCRRALRCIMNVVANERAERRKVAGGIADDAGHITTAEEQFEELS